MYPGHHRRHVSLLSHGKEDSRKPKNIGAEIAVTRDEYCNTDNSGGPRPQHDLNGSCHGAVGHRGLRQHGNDSYLS